MPTKSRTAKPTTITPAGDDVRRIRLAQLVANPDNPRDGLDSAEISALAESIRSVGILQPLRVRPDAGNDPGDPASHRFVILAGHRRAAALAELAASVDDLGLPVAAVDDLLGGPLCVVDHHVTDAPADSRVRALVENLQRVDLTPLEEAHAIADLVEAGMTQKDVAVAVGRNQGHVSKRLTLLKAIPGLRARIEDGSLPLDVAVDLAKMPIPVQEAAEDRLAKEVSPDSVRRYAVQQITDLRDHQRALKAAKAANLPAGVLQELPAGEGHITTNYQAGPWPMHQVHSGDDTCPDVTWYVRGTRGYSGASTDPDDAPWPGFDPDWIAGPFCCSPAEHRPQVPTHPALPSSTPTTASSSPMATPADRPTTDPARAKATAEATALLETANNTRAAFLTTLMTSKLPGDLDRALLVGLTRNRLYDFGSEMADLHGVATLLGIDLDLEKSPDHQRALAAHSIELALAHKTGNDPRRAALAFYLTDHERDAKYAINAHPHGYALQGANAHVAATYLTQLTAWGHTPHPLEQAVIDAATIPDAIADLTDVPVDDLGIDPVDDLGIDPGPTATCRSCGCTEDHACPGGCSWTTTDRDLCTACVEAATGAETPTPADDPQPADDQDADDQDADVDPARSGGEDAREAGSPVSLRGELGAAETRPLLLALAARVGVATSPKMTKAVLAAAIEGAIEELEAAAS